MRKRLFLRHALLALQNKLLWIIQTKTPMIAPKMNTIQICSDAVRRFVTISRYDPINSRIHARRFFRDKSVNKGLGLLSNNARGQLLMLSHIGNELIHKIRREVQMTVGTKLKIDQVYSQIR